MDGVACIAVVDGTAVAPPEVEITIGDNDETDAFRSTVTSRPVDNTTLLGQGPARYQTIVRLSYVNDEPEVEFNRQLMRCTAVQVGFPKVVSSVQLDVRCKIQILLRCASINRLFRVVHKSAVFISTVRCATSNYWNLVDLDTYTIKESGEAFIRNRKRYMSFNFKINSVAARSKRKYTQYFTRPNSSRQGNASGLIFHQLGYHQLYFWKILQDPKLNGKSFS